jgi:hypothetical protein
VKCESSACGKCPLPMQNAASSASSQPWRGQWTVGSGQGVNSRYAATGVAVPACYVAAPSVT